MALPLVLFSVVAIGAELHYLPGQLQWLGKTVTDFGRNLSNVFNSESSEAAPPVVGPSDKLPNQGVVTGGVEGAPPVDAGKQGKHVPGHNNEADGKSKWNKGENGVGETQQAWGNGKSVRPDGSVRVGQGDSGRDIKVHQDGGGNIHGYPTGE